MNESLVIITTPPEFEGAPLSTVMMTVNDEDQQIVQALLRFDPASGVAAFELADNLIDRTEVLVQYGPNTTEGVCAAVGKLDLARPLDQ